MRKSIHNRLFLKQSLYDFKMVEGKPIEEQLEKFSKIIDDLENIDIVLEDGDKALLLLNIISRSFEHFKDAMIYGRENVIKLKEVSALLKSKELQKQLETQCDNHGEGLTIKWKEQERRVLKRKQINLNVAMIRWSHPIRRKQHLRISIVIRLGISKKTVLKEGIDNLLK